MLKFPHLLVALLILTFACKKAEEQKTTPSGLTYTVVKSGDGSHGTKGNLLIFDFQLKDSKDSIWNQSYGDLPMQIPCRDSSEVKNDDGIIQMLNGLSPGDSVKTSMSAGDFFRKFVRRPVPPSVDSTLTLTYTVKAVDIMSEEEFVPWREKLTSERDDRQIKKYLSDNNIEAKEDTSGIHYVIHNNTGGTKPTVDNCVDVNYTGKFLKSGQVFDSNRIKFSLGRVIPGWQYAIPMLAQGDSATFYIPSGLAYGPMGPQYGLPADAILIFDVKLHGIANPDNTGECN